jgi:CRP/FNR family transcriptional regulator, cyclic AMP receptor protein
MEAETLADTLTSSSLLAGCSFEELADIAMRGAARSFKAGQPIMIQGDPGDTLWIVLKGLARVSMVAANGREIVLDYAECGAVLGEIAFLDGGERTASVEAVELVDALGLSRLAFAEIIGKHHGLALRLLQAMARRLRQNNTVVEADRAYTSGPRLARTLLRLTMRGEDDSKTRLKLATSPACRASRSTASFRPGRMAGSWRSRGGA